MPKNDEQFISDYLEGDEKALGLLIDKYLPDAYNFALKLTGDPSVSEDVAQESFIKAWKKFVAIVRVIILKAGYLASFTIRLLIICARKKSLLFHPLKMRKVKMLLWSHCKMLGRVRMSYWLGRKILNLSRQF